MMLIYPDQNYSVRQAPSLTPPPHLPLLTLILCIWIYHDLT